MNSSNSLIVMVNFMCLTRPKDAWIAGKIYFQSVSVRVLWKRLIFELVDWVKKSILIKWAGIIQSEGLNRTKKWRQGKFALLAWAGTFIFSCPWMLVLLVLRPLEIESDLYHHPLIFRHVDSDWDWHHWLLRSSSLWTLSYTTSFPGSLVCR